MDDLIKGISETFYWVRWSFPMEEDWPIVVGSALALVAIFVAFWRR